MTKWWRWLAVGSYVAAASCFAYWSFALTDPNLVLLNWAPYWQWQQWMWQTVFANKPLLVQTYVGIIAWLAVSYFGLLFVSVKQKWWSWWLPLLCGLPFFFSYNALSHDVFNYIFNAKMVLVYHANPHVQVALDFPHDDYVRFMHNTHTPAPYGYGWTVFSLIPYLMGFGKFILQWLMFRASSVLSIVGLYFAIRFTAKTRKFDVQQWQWVAVFCNPLLLIEVVSSSHNDLWMMAPAILALGMVAGSRKGKNLLISAATLGFSISTKFATALLLPVWLFLLARPMLPKKFGTLEKFGATHWPILCSLLMMMPLLTDRSQQFHPWYLTWVLVWIPLHKNKLWSWFVIVLSISSLLRYIPWLLNDSFTDAIIFQQKEITWIPAIIAGICLLGWWIMNTKVLPHDKKIT